MYGTPSRKGASDSPQLARFRISDRTEIAALLRSLQASRSLVTIVYGGDPRQAFVSTLLVVDAAAGRIYVDCAPDPRRNEEIVAAPSMTLHARLHGVKIECSLPTPRMDTIDGRAALSVPFPSSLFRWQRRGTHRVRIPRERRAFCELRSRYAGTGDRMRVRVFDISADGVSLSGFPPGLELAPGMVFEDAILHLDHETIDLDLRVVHVFRNPVGASDGGRIAGCQLLGIASEDLQRIQRYVVERDGRNDTGKPKP
jgi:flagellar brake protein